MALRLRYEIDRPRRLREHIHLVDGAGYFFFPEAIAPKGVPLCLWVNFTATEDAALLRGWVRARPRGGLWLELTDAERSLEMIEKSQQRLHARVASATSAWAARGSRPCRPLRERSERASASRCRRRARRARSSRRWAAWPGSRPRRWACAGTATRSPTPPSRGWWRSPKKNGFQRDIAHIPAPVVAWCARVWRLICCSWARSGPQIRSIE